MQTTDATGLREFITELRNWWSFSDSQVHTHSWHSREDFIERVLPKFSIEKKPSDGGEPITEEWLTSIGGDFDGTGGFDEWIFAARGTTKVSVDRWTDGTWRVFAFCEAVSVLLGNVKTRDDLRHLLAALGCPVNSVQHPNTEGGAR